MPFSKKTDEELVKIYKDGEDMALKYLIERYYSPVYNFTLRLVTKENTADIIQETFIKVWKNIYKYDIQKSSFKTWIFTIAKNTTTDFLRKKKSILFSDLDENDETFSENITDESLLPDEILQKLQDSELLNKKLEKLSLSKRTILIFHYQEELTFDEISKILEKPLNTVKSQHRRALLELRNMFK
ncbi:MAG: RNA polymerase sigma factor [Burkholderiales bacterium]|nr:RNA polymerase sigma factor [Burkholderiales bacterium]